MNREELAHECVQIEKAGGSVREFLGLRGCISPWGTWFRLQREELGREKWQITDGRGGEDMKKIALADKKKAVEIAICGGDPLEYLKKCGSKNPSALWYVIQKNLAEAEPEKYAQLLACKEKKEETVDLPRFIEEPPVETYAQQDEAEDFSYEAFRDYEKEHSITKPVNYGGFDVLSIRDPKSGDTFSYDRKHNMMEWRTEAGDEVSMTPVEWRELTEMLPDVMQVLGI